MKADLFDLSGKHIILTGGLGFLGLEYIKALRGQGAHLHVIDIIGRTKARLILRKHFSKEILKSVEYYQGDVTDEKSLISIRKDILRMYKKIDVLINNAALNPHVQSRSTSTYFDLEEWKKGIELNLTGTVLCTDIFRGCMKNGSSIINIASVYGIVGPDQRLYGKGFIKPAYYSASKGGVIALTKYLATLWGKEGIRVNCLVLGGVKHMQTDNFVKKYSQKTPLGRMARHDEFNGMLIFLASNASSYMTGAILTIDGGFSAW